MFARFVTGLVELLAPPCCAACRAPLSASALGFCAGCAPLIDALAPTAGADDVDACVFGGPLRDALHRLKYEGASETAPALARLMHAAAATFAGKVDCVVAVPLHPRRLRVRGYNQSALLAALVARQLGVAHRPWLLRRVTGTPAQVGSDRRARTAQLAHALVARRAARARACLVIDDVRTTGATLAEARRALAAAGARRVHTLALACVAPTAHGEESDPLVG